MVLPFQIQAIRNQRGWSQEELGDKAGMRRNAISRLESVEYGNLTINTLLRLARAFDCGLLVKFVPFSRLVGEFEDVSPSGLTVDEFEDDRNRLERWADVPEWVATGLLPETGGNDARATEDSVLGSEWAESLPIEGHGKSSEDAIEDLKTKAEAEE
jgi:transcriptional regulator with XRE-family HTH domain